MTYTIHGINLYNPSDINPDRPPCPFYGFTGPEGTLFLDSNDNRCGLQPQEDNPPCLMEMENEDPCWDECPVNDGYIIEHSVFTLLHIAPREFIPDSPSGEGWPGIPLLTWMMMFKYR